MEPIILPIYSMEGKEIDKIELDSSIFSEVVNAGAIYQAVNAYRSNQRKGLAATKTRGEVSGGGKKPWKQKGTGRARVGSTRSPLWRHGGVVFGPHPRDFSLDIPKKIKKVALRSAVYQKIRQNNLMVIDELKFDNQKTKEAARVLANLKVNQRKNSVLLMDKADEALRRPLRNISYLEVDLARAAHTYQILSAYKVIINKNGLNELIERLK